MRIRSEHTYICAVLKPWLQHSPANSSHVSALVLEGHSTYGPHTLALRTQGRKQGERNYSEQTFRWKTRKPSTSGPFCCFAGAVLLGLWDALTVRPDVDNHMVHTITVQFVVAGKTRSQFLSFGGYHYRMTDRSRKQLNGAACLC